MSKNRNKKNEVIKLGKKKKTRLNNPINKMEELNKVITNFNSQLDSSQSPPSLIPKPTIPITPHNLAHNIFYVVWIQTLFIQIINYPRDVITPSPFLMTYIIFIFYLNIEGLDLKYKLKQHIFHLFPTKYKR